MTKVTFYPDASGQYTGFDADGHAGSGEAGEDLVCAAVSVLVLTAVNALEQLTEDDFTVDTDEERGRIRLSISGDHSREADILLRALAIGLTGIEDDEANQDYIDIIFEEV